jgi:hypothetical protein
MELGQVHLGVSESNRGIVKCITDSLTPMQTSCSHLRDVRHASEPGPSWRGTATGGHVLTVS